MGEGAAEGGGGTAERLAPGLCVVTAPNPGPMTFKGTRSYILGGSEVALIDPGPADPRHLAALEAALQGRRLAAILVTHAHLDHSEGARALQVRLGGAMLGFGERAAARSPTIAALAAAGGLGGGEGIDPDFVPDRRLHDEACIAGPGWSLRALHTPGHLGDHLCFHWIEGNAIFSGDILMGWSTTLISPPDGDLAAYRASLTRLRGLSAVLYPGHGPPVSRPDALIDRHLAHREAREAQILALLGHGPARLDAVVATIYAGLDQALRPAAARNVLAHLIDLVDRGLVRPRGAVTSEAVFVLT